MVLITAVDLDRYVALLKVSMSPRNVEGLVKVCGPDKRKIGYISAEAAYNLETAETLCKRYASAAPKGALTEACVRVSGFLSYTRTPAFHITRRFRIGSLDVPFADGIHGDPVKRSGAAAILRTWRRPTIAATVD